MFIFLDESGSFVNASKPGKWNSIAAYMSPERERRPLQKILSALKHSSGVAESKEIKLRDISEAHYFRFLRQLKDLDGVVFTVATDAGLNQDAEILEHRRIQAEKIIEHKDKMHFQSARDGLQLLSNQVGALAPQLYIQLLCQINLIETVIRQGVLYFVQRHPRFLGNFRWRIDQKNSTRTDYEKAFLAVTPAFLQSISLRKPMTMLIGADYSAFSRFDYPESERPTYLRDAYGIETNEEGPVTNIGKLVLENHEFVDSVSNYGVQVSDLLASGVRRCLRQQFEDNETAAKLLGCLMVQNYKNRPPIEFLGFSKSEHFVEGEVARLSKIMEGCCRSMLVKD